MSNSNSRERTIYRSLAGKIQLGFYDNETRFPSAKEIASQYQVSYCPAQRALKMLEQGGLIKLCRGKSTAILDKPYRDYLESPVFKQRAHSLLDVIRTLNLILPDLCLYGMIHGDSRHLSVQPGDRKALSIPGRYLYQQFENSFLALGSRTALSLYYDISSFAESALLDILYSKLGSSKADDLMTDVSAEYDYCVRNSRALPPVRIRQRLEHLSGIFYGIIESYLLEVPGITAPGQREVFSWAPRKGRTRYCDTLAINIVCKINQGVYPVGTLLPSGSALADIYHVSEITMRRTIHLLNQLGVVKTLNGIGTRVISASGPELLYKIRELMMEDPSQGFSGSPSTAGSDLRACYHAFISLFFTGGCGQHCYGCLCTGYKGVHYSCAQRRDAGSDPFLSPYDHTGHLPQDHTVFVRGKCPAPGSNRSRAGQRMEHDLPQDTGKLCCKRQRIAGRDIPAFV